MSVTRTNLLSGETQTLSLLGALAVLGHLFESNQQIEFKLLSGEIVETRWWKYQIEKPVGESSIN
jgi:hypothetical protein